MKTLVTGSSGFLGANLIRRNPDFIGLDITPSPTTRICVDLLDVEDFRSVIRSFEIRKVVHCAGVQYPVPKGTKIRSFFEKNVVIASSLCKAVGQNLEKFVYVSTDMVYGIQPHELISESAPSLPIGPYGASKMEAEMLFQSNLPGSKLCILRPRLILGRGRDGTIGTLSRLLARNYPIPIIGKGQNRYQFIYVEDVASAIELCLRDGVSGIFNLGSDDSPTLNSLFPRVLKELGASNTIIHFPRLIVESVLFCLSKFNLSPLVPEQYKLGSRDIVLDTRKIKDLGWRPTKSDYEMLYESVNYQIELMKRS